MNQDNVVLDNKNIVLIGAGNIGRRHLEALVQTNIAMTIYIIDPVPLTEEYLNRLNKKDGKEIICDNRWENLPDKLDLAIIATASSVRRKLFEKLVSVCEVDYIVFEKVLFQRESDFKEVESLLTKKQIKAWVNCGRRESASWQKVKELLEAEKNFEMTIIGSDWGFCCNGIHMMDLIAFLAGGNNIEILTSSFEQEIYESKRPGYWEVNGTIAGKVGKCSFFTVSCNGGGEPRWYDIVSENIHLRISEDIQQMAIARKEDRWIEKNEAFPLQYVSVGMVPVYEKILNGEGCMLPSYEESMDIHLAFEKEMCELFEQKGFEKGDCPIT